MTLTTRLRLAALVTPLVLAVPVAAQSVPGPGFEQVIGLRSVGAPAISPDGRSVVFTVRSTEWKDNRYDTELWMAREGETPHQLTRTEKGSSTSPRWSPDGRWIAFLADRGDRQQIYLLRAGGGEAHKLTEFKEGVSAFRWSPDGRRIAFTAVEPEGREARERRERFGAFAVEDAEFRQTHLWVVDLPVALGAGLGAAECVPPAAPDSTRADSARAAVPACATLPSPTRLTEGRAFTVGGFSWSPDGRSIALEHRRDPLINSQTTTDISVLDLASRRVRPLVTEPGYDGNPVWSPDSRWVLYSSAGTDTTSHFYRNNRIAKIPAAGGASIVLGRDFDEQLGSLAWTPAGIYALAWQGAARRPLLRIDPASGAVRPLTGSPEYVLTFDFAADGRTLAFVGQTPSTLPEIYRASVAGFRPVSLTDMTRQIADWGVGSSELISWTSTDGERIEGVLHKPRDFDPNRKYPLFVVIHGGPTGIDFPTPVTGYVYPVMQWLAKGALVLRPNYRGSAGYGERFRSLNVRNLGVGDAWDVLSGVDHLVRLGIVDTTRMGAMGWSQGGYISAFLTTTSDRFRAVSVGAGISNWMTYYVNTDIHPFTRQYLRATPWDDPEVYARTSPMTYVKQATTPTLIQHGEFDRRVPIANAYELFQGLQDVGVPTRLVVYSGFGHGIDKPREHLAALWHNWQWFGAHVWGEQVRAPAGVGELVP